MNPIVIIPTYEEAENIDELIPQVRGAGCDILVVDDNSPDGTSDVVMKYNKVDQGVQLLCRKTERGRGSAGIEGFKWCLNNGYKTIIEMDADFSHNPRYLDLMVEEIFDGADVVIGSRFVEGGQDVGRSKHRELITSFARKYMQIVLGLKTKDCTSGYRAFKREVLESININSMTAKGPNIVQEVLYKIEKQNKYLIKEIPIKFVERKQGESKLGWKGLVTGFFYILFLRWSK